MRLQAFLEPVPLTVTLPQGTIHVTIFSSQRPPQQWLVITRTRERPIWMSTFSHKHTHLDSQAFACPVSSTYTVLPTSKIQISSSFLAQFRGHLYPVTSSLLCSHWNPMIPVAFSLVPLILISFTLYYYIVFPCLWVLIRLYVLWGQGPSLISLCGHHRPEIAPCCPNDEFMDIWVRRTFTYNAFNFIPRTMAQFVFFLSLSPTYGCFSQMAYKLLAEIIRKDK